MVVEETLLVEETMVVEAASLVEASCQAVTSFQVDHTLQAAEASFNPGIDPYYPSMHPS